MINHILCAVDLTHLETERALLRRASELAEFYGASLSVVTVIPDYGMSIVGSFFQEGTMRAAAASASDQLHAVVAETLPGVEGVQHIVEVGTAYERILDAIDLSKADLVVIGAHKPNLMDKLQGPNSSRVARKAPCSVLIVRD